ncbi:NADH-quinone oxidoreductase subunit L [Conexivisphaera calida]|uniref:NADH-ubiquinone oxidoreductase chain L n=1 Tax=Conexivisphaera calida TaxID=1874277 RepID=A0A4P2VGV0_9ARCH|nr:proton-conducting transporter membrane subunit [Conexivisphaera calida]BBE42482.1 NADH-ubiquinone oxidoreductase chain L [Conexivisphaera calida]
MIVSAPWYSWSSIWLVPFAAAVVMAVAWLLGVRRERFYGLMSVLSILVAAIVSTFALYNVLALHETIDAVSSWNWVSLNLGSGTSLTIGVGSYLDGLGAIMAVIVSWLSFLIAVYSLEYMKGDWGVQRYFFFITFFVGSMLLLVVAENLVLMFIGWEGTGLASYALIGHWYTDEEDKWVGVPGRKALGLPMYFEPSNSGVRALMFTRLGDVGFLVGMSVLFLVAHTFSIPGLAASAGSWMAYLANNDLLAAVLFIFTLGALAKSAQFPFHEWLVTAMTGPTPVSALIHAATMVKAGVYFVLRFAPIFFVGAVAAGVVAEAQSQVYFGIVAALAALTAFMMATMAIVSNEFKLVLAYSTASQLGYMILAAAAGGLLVTQGSAALAAMDQGVFAGLAQLLSHAVFKAALFLIAGWALHVAESRFIDDMGNYAKYMKATAVAMWLSGLSLAAIPPLSGFFSKELVLESVAQSGYTVLYLVAVVTAFFTAAYTTRLAVRVFHLPPIHAHAEEYEGHEGAHGPREAPSLMLGPYFLLALGALLLGIFWPIAGSKLSQGVYQTLSVLVRPEFMPAIDVATIAITSLLVVDILLVVAAYLRRVDFMSAVRSSRLLSDIHSFLFDRWYINSIIYYAFVYSFIGLSLVLHVVDHGIDVFYHRLLPTFARGSSAGLRATFGGRTDYSLALYLSLTGVLVLLILMVWGVI